jgi:hypothetical protein
MADAVRTPIKRKDTMPTSCPECGGPVTDGTSWCELCQRRSHRSTQVRLDRRNTSSKPRRWSVYRRHLHLLAALMSLLLPGAGQVYKGRVVQGAVWFAVVAAAYWFFGLPGILIHAMCVITAGSQAREVRRAMLSDGLEWRRAH